MEGLIRKGFRVATWDEVQEFGRSNLHEQKLLPPIGGGAGYALVGAVGAVTTVGATTATPAYGTGSTRAAGNLLICWAMHDTASSQPTSTWSSIANTNGLGISQCIFWRVATGADAAPVISAVDTNGIQCQLAEFSGGATTSPTDKTTTGTIAASGGTMANPTADTAAGELVIYLSSQFYSANATKTNSIALNNGATANDTNNNSISTSDHYVFGWGINTSNAAVDTMTLTMTTTKLSQALCSLCSFKLAPPTMLPGQVRHRFPGAAQNRRSAETSRGRF